MTYIEEAARALPDGLYSAVAVALTAHNMQIHHGGDGYTEPRETWVTCSCGASIWEWQEFYNERDDDPEERFEEHLTWAVSQGLASWLAEYLLSDGNVAPIARALYVAQMAGADEEPDWENETGYVYDGFMADARSVLQAVLGKEQP